MLKALLSCLPLGSQRLEQQWRWCAVIGGVPQRQPWTGRAGWVRLQPQRFPGARASGRPDVDWLTLLLRTIEEEVEQVTLSRVLRTV